MLNTSSPSYLIVLVVAILVSLVIHEFMHALAGHLLGDDTASEEGRLTLNPLKHVDPFMTVILPIVTVVLFHVPILAAKPVPFDPRRVKYDEFGAAIIAAAGPFSNLLLAVIGGLLVNHVLPYGFWQNAFVIFTQLNVALFVFNLLPIPPLDGSRVLYAFSPEGVQQFLRSIEQFGLVIVFLLVFTPGFSSFLVSLNNAVLNWLP